MRFCSFVSFVADLAGVTHVEHFERNQVLFLVTTVLNNILVDKVVTEGDSSICGVLFYHTEHTGANKGGPKEAKHLFEAFEVHQFV